MTQHNYRSTTAFDDQYEAEPNVESQLASAPVAGEAQPVAWRYRRDSQKEAKWMSGQDPTSAEWFYADHSPKTTELREGAFQLAPARDHVDWEPLYAAPQPSAEEIRNQALEEAAKIADRNSQYISAEEIRDLKSNTAEVKL